MSDDDGRATVDDLIDRDLDALGGYGFTEAEALASLLEDGKQEQHRAVRGLYRGTRQVLVRPGVLERLADVYVAAVNARLTPPARSTGEDGDA